MRQAVDMSCFETTGEDGFPVAGHGVKSWCEKTGVKLISREEATAICAARRAREPKPASPNEASTIYGPGPADPPYSPSEMDARMTALEASATHFEEQCAQLVRMIDGLINRVVESEQLNTVRFQALAAEQDKEPSHDKYMELGQVLSIPQGATPEFWAQAIAHFKKGKP